MKRFFLVSMIFHLLLAGIVAEQVGKLRFQKISEGKKGNVKVQWRRPHSSEPKKRLPLPSLSPAKTAKTSEKAIESVTPAPVSMPQAWPVYRPSPVYPLIAREEGWEGEVFAEIEFNKEGKAKTVLLKKSSGYPILDKTVLETLEMWRGEPQSILSVPLRFQFR